MLGFASKQATHQAFVLHDDREPASAHALLPRQRVRQPYVIDGVLPAQEWVLQASRDSPQP